MNGIQIDIKAHRSNLEKFKETEWYEGVESFLTNEFTEDRSPEFEIGMEMMEGAWLAFTKKKIGERSVYLLMGYAIAEILCRESICSFSEDRSTQSIESELEVKRCANHASNCPCSSLDKDSTTS